MNTEQRALQFQCEGHALVGIIDVPERPLPRGVLVVSCGAQYRIGSHRHYTLMARLLAPRGIPVMRFDCRGIGDSEGLAMNCEAAAQDIRAAIREFFLQMPDLQEVVLWGLGDGASAAALYAHLDQRVHGLVLLNPWRKVGSRHPVARSVSLPLAQRIVAGLACFDGAALLVVGGQDASARQFAELMERNDTPCRRVTIAGANHTFASREWRDEVAELSANWLVSW
jgi:alpha-beta hydrolase superfamily lysophospholipase